MSSTIGVDLTSTSDLLCRWLQHISPEGFAWLDQKSQQIADGAALRIFFTTFSAVPRYTGKQDLDLSAAELQTAQTYRQGWNPQGWSVDQVARTLLLLALPQNNAQEYVKTLEQVFTTADMGELVALYQALPLLPYPQQFRSRASEGLRSNIVAVFNAIALRNPYPQEYFDELAWNQMVLKALFVGSPLHQIQGLGDRANAQLGQMLTDYANERLAANRSVSPELWQLVEQCKKHKV